uniref:Uncharacterized protein n=1 Tax=Trichinella nativa TaxID=6335 RepID=A0A0V1KIK1_9BILA
MPPDLDAPLVQDSPQGALVRLGLPSSVWETNHRSVSPVEKGRKASLFFSAPLASRKWSGLKLSGCSKYCGSWRAELRMGYTSVF